MIGPLIKALDKPVHFSPRQIEILRLIAEGLRMKEIGIRLKISIKTVSTHKIRIWEKLTNVGTDDQFLAYARKYFALPECASPEVTDERAGET